VDIRGKVGCGGIVLILIRFSFVLRDGVRMGLGRKLETRVLMQDKIA